MSKATKTLDKVLRGNADANIRFADLCSMLTHFGFAERIRGDHHIFSHDLIEDILNLQPKKGMAKPYQVKQVRLLFGSSRLLRGPDSLDEGSTNEEDHA